jgi:hypothetical protein
MALAQQIPNVTLCERTQEHDQITLARIYRLAFDVLQHPKYTILYTPLPHVHDNIDRSHAVCLATDEGITTAYDYKTVSHQLIEFWSDMWVQHGLVAWNFQMYRQPDERIALVNFDHFGFHNSTADRHWITMPCNVSLNFFFADSVFPNDFYNCVRHIEGVSPVFHSDTMV